MFITIFSLSNQPINDATFDMSCFANLQFTMNIDVFLVIAALNWPSYVLALLISILTLLPIMKKHSYGWLDPLRITLIFAMFANAVPIFFLFNSLISVENFVYFVLSETDNSKYNSTNNSHFNYISYSLHSTSVSLSSTTSLLVFLYSVIAVDLLSTPTQEVQAYFLDSTDSSIYIFQSILSIYFITNNENFLPVVLLQYVAYFSF